MILWYNMRYENCTSKDQTFWYGRQSSVIHRLCEGAGNVYKVNRRADAGRRICPSPRPWYGVDNHSPEESL